MISTPVGVEEKMVDTEEREVGAEEGRRAQETAKKTPKNPKNRHSKKETTAFFVFPPLIFLD